MLCDVLIEILHLVYLSFTQMVNFDPVVGFIFTIDFFIMCLNVSILKKYFIYYIKTVFI